MCACCREDPFKVHPNLMVMDSSFTPLQQIPGQNIELSYTHNILSEEIIQNIDTSFYLSYDEEFEQEEDYLLAIDNEQNVAGGTVINKDGIQATLMPYLPPDKEYTLFTQLEPDSSLNEQQQEDNLLQIPEKLYAYFPGYFSLDRTYEWYKTQMDTGPASLSNCGPTCVSMAIHYYDNLDVPVSEIRNLNYRDGGWWYTTDITFALSVYGIPHQIVPISSPQDMLDSLNDGHILILCINMSILTPAGEELDNRYGRYHSTGTGHFIIIKGYVHDGEWLIVYDPSNYDTFLFYDFYPDGNPYGKDRFYKTEEIYASMLDWWAYYFEIGNPDEEGSQDFHLEKGIPYDYPIKDVAWGGFNSTDG